MDESFKLCTFNVNGLGQKQKRMSVFRRLMKLKCVIFIQETHSTPAVEQKWKDEWGGNIEYSHGSSSQNGVAILFPPHLDYTIIQRDRDEEGRMLILKIVLGPKEYTLVNIYAPVRSQPKKQLDFIYVLKEKLSLLENDTCLIGGDFNLYMSPELDKLDRMSDKNDNDPYRQEILQILDTYDMIDLFRVLNPDSRRYTWHSRGLASRLDYWFVSEECLNTTKNIDIKPGVFSDHSIVFF